MVGDFTPVKKHEPYTTRLAWTTVAETAIVR
jgi:hypothetical protein